MAVEFEIPCPKLPEVGELPSIKVAGGAELKAFLNFAEGVPTDCKATFNLLLQLPPLLAVSACLLKVLEVMGKLTEFFKAVPNPPEMGSAAVGVVEALGELVPCIPALAPINIVCMIKGILELIVRFLNCFIDAVCSVIDFQATIDIQAAEGNPVLQAKLQCAQDNAAVSLNNLMTSLGPIEPIFAMVSNTAGVVGLSIELPDFSSMNLEAGADLDCDALLGPVRDGIDTIQQVIDALPC